MTALSRYPGALILALALGGCRTEPVPEQAPANPGNAAQGEPRAQVTVLSGAQVTPGRTGARREQIAELLFQGLQAMDADRLLTPPDNNAYDRFRRVLDMDPRNAIALEGMDNITRRYATLAREAAVQGLFDQAELFLDRARFVDARHPAIAQAQEAIAAERQSADLFFDFESGAIVARNQAVRDRLANIAMLAREQEAFFLITAPSDDHARWMYSVMRDAVEGYRLRGTIEIAARYSVRLRIPSSP